MKKYENKVVIILSVGTIISIFAVIRECSYPLIYDSSLLRWLFVSQNDEKMISNIAYSYIAAYIFYIMQVYIPKIMYKKKINIMLVPKVKKLVIYIYELSYVLDKIVHKGNEGLSVDTKIFPLYYRLTSDGKTNIKKVSDVNTLLDMQKRIEELHNCILDRFVIYSFDVGIIELWEKIPLEYYREIIKFIKLNREKHMSLVMDVEENSKIVEDINKLFGIKTYISLSDVEDRGIQDKYEHAFRQSGFSELDLGLAVVEKNK